MNRLPKHLVFCFIFALTSLRIWARQTTPVIDQSTSGQGSTLSSTLTADGVSICSEEFKSQSVPEGVYRMGSGVLPPTLTKAPKATFSDESRKYASSVMKAQHLKRFEAKSLVGLTVDTNGLPQHICVFNELGHGFDRRAFDAVSESRFQPATRDGKAVPVPLTIEVTFALW
jgi:hypothetical protein